MWRDAHYIWLKESFMKTMVSVVVVSMLLVLSGCAGLGGAATNSSLDSGTEPGQGPYPSQVVGP